MMFRRVPLAAARGHILGHNVSQGGRRLLRKGRRVDEAALELLQASGHESVFVAELEPGDVNEDAAAERIARALVVQGAGLGMRALGTGRVALRAETRGVVRLRLPLLEELNAIAGVTLATPAPYSVVAEGALVGTLKIIPFALPREAVERAEALGRAAPLAVLPLGERRVHLLVSGASGQEHKLLPAYEQALAARLAALGTRIAEREYIALAGAPEAQLGAALRRHLDAAADLVIIAGETATMDKDDLSALAIAHAGGTVTAFGAPVFPGNLLLLGYRDRQAILGAPGCARSRARNVVDLILPRLLVGEMLGAREVAALGPGGLIGGDPSAVEASDVEHDGSAGHD